jgi:ABC-type transporter Mla MlaB component
MPEEPDTDSSPVPIAEEEAALTPDETCLRDAALHYAEGEFEAAHDILSARLAEPLIDAETAELLTFALFDVYRCTGNQERFNALALDYANRFGRSPGEWFSVPDIVAAQGLAHGPASATPTAQPLWQCPETLDAAAWADCMVHNPSTSPACAINWELLRHIDADQAPALAAQLHSWCERPVELHWSGVEALLSTLKAQQTPGAAASHATWWLMHLDLLRILQQQDAFEDLALDYCVCFEVSPPSWSAPLCSLLQATDATEQSGFGVSLASKSHSGFAEIGALYAICELQGNITGEATAALQTLNQAALSASQLAVSCAHLGRVDFNAASALLNWVVECDAKGCEVRFTRLPRLVALFFELLGMHQFASLSTGAR